MLDVRDLTVRFGSRTAIDRVSFTAEPGRRIGILGPAGSGKSVLAKALLGLVERPGLVGGSIKLDGIELVGAAERTWCRLRTTTISLVTQDARAALLPTIRVGDQVAEPLARGLFGSRKRAKARAVDMLARMGLHDPGTIARKYPADLSGGQRQRVGLAKALACEPAVLVADSPTAALDVVARAAILDLLSVYARTHTLVFCTQDASLIPYVCDEVCVLGQGRVTDSAAVG